MSKKGRGRRTAAERLEAKDKRSTVGYVRNLQHTLRDEQMSKLMEDAISGKLEEEFNESQALEAGKQ